MERITNLRQFMHDPLRFLEERNSGAGLRRVPMGHQNFYLVYGPELAQEILVKRNETFVQNRMVFGRISPVTGKKGLVQLNGEKSKEARRKARALFTQSSLAEMRLQIESIVGKALPRIKDGDLDISAFMSELILSTAFRLFLGIDLSEASRDMARDFLELNRICGERMRKLVPLPDARIPIIRRRLRGRIERALREGKPESISVPGIFAGDADVIDHCMTFLFAGHETTAASLAFTFLLLAERPELQEKISQGDAEAAKLIYREALTRFPPAYMLVREAASDTELAGEKIRKGSPIVIALASMQKRGDCFMPFGAGPKNCVGEALAYVEAETVIMEFCRNFSFTRSSGEITAVAHITLHPGKGQKLCVSRRK